MHWKEVNKQMAFKKSNPSIGSSYGGAKPTRSNLGGPKPGTMKKSKSKGSKSYGKLYG